MAITWICRKFQPKIINPLKKKNTRNKRLREGNGISWSSRRGGNVRIWGGTCQHANKHLQTLKTKCSCAWCLKFCQCLCFKRSSQTKHWAKLSCLNGITQVIQGWTSHTEIFRNSCQQRSKVSWGVCRHSARTAKDWQAESQGILRNQKKMWEIKLYKSHSWRKKLL